MSVEFVQPRGESLDDFKAESEQFVWGFNLSEVDPSLIFDESEPKSELKAESKTEINQAVEKNSPTFSEWLSNTVPPDDDEHLETTLPTAFSWAQKESHNTSSRLGSVSLGGLNMIGGALGSLMGIIGACGPVCLHALGSVTSAGSSGLSLLSPGFGGFSSSGFSVDSKGNFQMSGNINSLSKATGLSKEALLSGKYSTEDILTSFFSIFGEGIYQLLGLGIIECLIDGLIPTTKAA